MKVFISWSGERSKIVAEAWRDTLGVVLQHVKPWVSFGDIHGGDRWPADLASELEASTFGIACLTRENLRDAWLMFEAGAISKAHKTAGVAPYIVDIKPSDIGLPLSQFQARHPTREDSLALVLDINRRSATPLDPASVPALFDSIMWPKLEAAIKRALEKKSDDSTAIVAKPREERAVLEDLVQLVRGLDARLAALETASRKPLPAPERYVQENPFDPGPPDFRIDVKLTQSGATGRIRQTHFVNPGSDLLERIARHFGLVHNDYGKTWRVIDEAGSELEAGEACTPGLHFGYRDSKLEIEQD